LSRVTQQHDPTTPHSPQILSTKERENSAYRTFKNSTHCKKQFETQCVARSKKATCEKLSQCVHKQCTENDDRQHLSNTTASASRACKTRSLHTVRVNTTTQQQAQPEHAKNVFYHRAYKERTCKQRHLSNASAATASKAALQGRLRYSTSIAAATHHQSSEVDALDGSCQDLPPKRRDC
jgi:hypothetical protein